MRYVTNTLPIHSVRYIHTQGVMDRINLLCYNFNKKGGVYMVCPKCGSTNVQVQLVQDISIKEKKHGFFWWIIIGWWWIPIKWLFFTFPALIIKLFGHRKVKVITKNYSMSLCQNCGYSWKN